MRPGAVEEGAPKRQKEKKERDEFSETSAGVGKMGLGKKPPEKRPPNLTKAWPDPTEQPLDNPFLPVYSAYDLPTCEV